MRFKVIKIIVFFGLICIFQSADLFACTCESPPPVYKKFNESAAVFSGKVISRNIVEKKFTETDEDGKEEVTTTKDRIFRFQLFESFKGKKEKFVDINLGEFNPTCQSNFTVGESYLIYAYKRDDEDFLRDGACSRSVGLESADLEIETIREKLAGKPEAKIYGNIFITDNDPNSTGYISKNLPNLTVVLQSEQKRFETKTGKKGNFKFYNEIPDGIYKLFPVVSSEVRPYSLDDFTDHASIKVEKGKFSPNEGGNNYYEFFDAKYTNFSVRRNNGIKGKVFDGEGKPVKFAAVRLIPVAVPFGKIESDNTFDEDKEGNFSISDITPGKYYLVAEIYAPFGGKDKVRIFYPQAETPEKATPVEIKPIDELNFDFVLPRKYVLRPISGNILWADGQIVENAELKLFKSKNHKVEEFNDEIPNTGFDNAKTDELGNFILWGFENEEYWIHSESDYEITTGDESEDIKIKGTPIKIKIEKNNQPLKLTLIKP